MTTFIVYHTEIVDAMQYLAGMSATFLVTSSADEPLARCISVEDDNAKYFVDYLRAERGKGGKSE